MNTQTLYLIPLCLLFLLGCKEPTKQQGNITEDVAQTDLRYPAEKNFASLKQLTFGGNNAEAYFSFDDKHLVFQSDYKDWGLECDQIFYMPLSGHGDKKPQLLSTGKGRTTCSYFMPGNEQIVYASTHEGAEACPQTPRMVNGKYVWAIYESFDIYTADLEGNLVKQLTDEPGYDAEATLSPDGKKMVFTSTRSGDLELYTMDIDGSNVKQVTDELGYDGGAFFSPDGSQLIFRASRPKTPEEVKNYKDLLAKGLVQPTDMELFVCDVDGSNMKQITKLGGANWAPYFHPSGDKVIFSTNHHSESKRKFNLFMINVDGTGLRQISHDGIFDAFPMFSYDGKKLVFSSNRHNGGGHDTNIFLADWEE